MTSIIRRLGSTPQERGSNATGTCPDMFLLDDGRIAIIGTDMTEELTGKIPADAGVADYERIVVIPREVLDQALNDILALGKAR